MSCGTLSAFPVSFPEKRMKAALITAALSLALLGATDAQARSDQPHPARTAHAAQGAKAQTGAKPAKKAVPKKHAKKARKTTHKKTH
jgi:hypothetical protein